MSPRRFAVVGSPIDHSLSPVLHRRAHEVLGIEDAHYGRHRVEAGQLAQFLAEGPGRELEGLSVTMPGKPEAFALASEADDVSRALGISNTLIRREGGGWRAENHDVHGIVATLRDHGAQAPERGAVLGSGATALSAVAALADLGVGTVLVTARTPHKLDPLEELAAARGISVQRIPWERHHEALDAAVVVSALAIDGALAVAHRWRSARALPRPGLLLDVLYEPWPAPVAEVVARGGAVVADGLEMLAHQADMQVRSMLSVPSAPVAEMLAAAREALVRRDGGAPR
ncbi:shikimate dehydrogenase [Brachybacterium sp. AOP43-C2-M15]|uniref:shikimate dehydrogenase n=1 Tax=Brachybacterium sp. AOP43-C2-M15 TaxID=3457661 RepID=UPI0040344A3A